MSRTSNILRLISKTKSPKIYKRLKYIYREEPPIKEKPTGIQPTLITVLNGKIQTYNPNVPELNYEKSELVAYQILHNYEKAMTRRRTYVYPAVGESILNGAYGVKTTKGSIIVDLPAYEAPTLLTLFHPTHFAPSSLRDGADLVKLLAESSLPTMFTVTSDLTPMLVRLGFVKTVLIPLNFGGELVMKDVLFNRSTTRQAIENELSNSSYGKFVPIEYIDDIMESIHLPLKYSKELYYPKLSTFKIKDIIK